MKRGKIIAMGFALVMILLSFTACSKEGAKDKENKAMGRYVEKTISMPKEVENGSEIAYIFLKNPKNQIEIYTQRSETGGSNSIYKNTLNGKEWKKEKAEWINKDMLIYSIAYDANAVLYGLGMNKDGIPAVFVTKDGKEAKEVKLEGFDQLKQDDVPLKIYCMKDNILILGFQDHLTAYQGTKEIMNIESGGPVCAIFEKEVFLLNHQNNGFIVYDLESGSKKAESPFDSDTSNVVYTSGNEGKWYVCNEKGIHQQAQEGNIWETIADGSLNSMSSPKYSIEEIIAGSQNDFYVVYQYGDGQRIVKQYVFDETVKTVPSKTLSITTLKESPTIHQAVVDFQNTNPDIQVDYQVLLEDEGIIAADAMKKLNTELLAKKGPDLIVLDGIPIQSYVDKGILMDLSPVMADLAEKEGVYINLIEASKTGEAIYGIPVKIGLPIIFGTKEAVLAGDTLENLARYAKDNATTELFGKNIYTYETLMKQLAEVYSNEYQNEKGQIDEKNLLTFLVNVKIISDQTKAVEKEAQPMEELFRYNVGSTDLLIQKSAECFITEYQSSIDYYAPFAGIEKIGGSFAPLSNSFLPHGTIGINNESTNQDLAIAFLKSLFTEPMQKVDLEDGFPVSKKGVDTWNKEKNDFFIGTPSFEATQPTEEKIKEVTGLCGTLTKSIRTDTVLVEMITKEAIPYLKGERTAEETASAIIGQSKAYLAE